MYLRSSAILKYIYLPKLVSTEQFWSTIHTNTRLLAEISSQYKLWFLKIHYPLPQCVSFFVRQFLTLSREQCFSSIQKNNC